MLTYALGRGLDYYDIETVDVIVDKLKSLDLHYPKVSEAQRQQLLEAKKVLEAEKEGKEIIPQKHKIATNGNEA